MNFCSHCGGSVALSVPLGDHLPRFICQTCNIIHYQNPKMVVGTIPEWEDKILLCRRAIEPKHGLWTLPAGFMENSETTAQGAMRETWEEAYAVVEIQSLYSLYNLPHINQVYLMFRAKLLNLDFGPGPESLEVALFREQDIPWDALAFRTIEATLKTYFADRKTGEFRFHMGDISPPPK